MVEPVEPSAPSGPEPPSPVTQSQITTLIAGSAILTLAVAMGIAGGATSVEEPPAYEPVEVIGSDSDVVTLGYPGRASDAWNGQEHLLGVAREVFADLDQPLARVPVSGRPHYHGVVQRQLRDRTIDMATTSRAFSREVCASYTGTRTSVPVARLLDALMVPAGNPLEVDELGDVVDQNLTLGVPDHGPYRERAADAGVSQENLVETPLTFDLIEGGDVDAYLGDSQTFNWLMAGGETDLEVTDPFAPVVDGREIEEYTGFYLADRAVATQVDRVLGEMRDDGRLLAFGSAWGMTQDHLPPQTAQRPHGCAGS